LGNNGYLDPLWAAWLPNLAMTGLAAFFFGRMRCGFRAARKPDWAVPKRAEELTSGIGLINIKYR
ncbi:MAG: hypothetical protein ACHQ5A_11485, partial [Opitutales bacterium]